MRKLTLVILSCLAAGNAAHADSAPKKGDIFLISRDGRGVFAGSHKLYDKYAHSLKQVTYCNQIYYVRRQTVAWTQLEAERGNVVRIEYNFGRGWRPICENPETQVSLKDLGIEKSAEDVVQGRDEVDNAPRNFLSAVSSVFNRDK